MTSNKPQSVLVIGAGPAGLTAAYRLASAGHHVTLLNRSQSIGEHLRREGDPPLSILGCHKATWTLLYALGVLPMPPTFMEASLEFLVPDGMVARYPHNRLPTPLRQLLTIGRFTGLSRRERWKLLSWLEQIWDGSLQLATDLEIRTAQDWLESLGHRPSSLQTVWQPLARWLTGADLQTLSADTFVQSLKSFFLSAPDDDRIWVPRRPWHRIFVEPICKSLALNGAKQCVGIQAGQFEYDRDRITGLRIQDGTVLRADWYVAAVPHHQLTPLLPERWLTRYAYFQHITELSTVPCTVIQIRTSHTIAAPRQILMGTGPFPWMACKPSEADQQLVAALAMPENLATPDTEPQVAALLRSLGLLQQNSQITGFRQQEMAHAQLALPPGTKLRRPIQSSPISNLLVAGAWTDTGWPANLESAIISGERCADIISGNSPPA